MAIAVTHYRAYMAFGVPPGVTPTAGQWVELKATIGGRANTSRLISGEIVRGRNVETEKMQPGRLRLKLWGRDRALEPGYAASPYYPNVVPTTPVKIEAVWTPAVGSPVTYARFTGTVDDFVPTWNPEGDVMVPCTDAMPDLQAAQLRNPYVNEVLADAPTFYYRMNDPAGSAAVVDSSGNARPAGVSGAPTFGVPDPITDEADGAVTVGNMANFIIAPEAVGIVGSGPWWIGGWFRSSDTTATPRPLWLQYMLISGVMISLLVGVDSSGFGIVQMLTSGTGLQSVTGSADLRDGTWHYIVASRETDGTTTLYVDGSSVGSVAAPAQSLGFYGAPVIGYSPTASLPATFDVDEIAGRIGFPISGTRVAAHYDAHNAWLGYRAGARVSAVLSMIGWAGVTDLDVGQSTLVSAGDLEGKTALEDIQRVEDWEQGMFFLTKAGVATFYDRHYFLLNNASVATFGDATGELRITDVVPESASATIHNEVKVQRIGGALQSVWDAASVARYGLRTWPQSGAWSIGVQSELEALELARWKVTHEKDPLFTIRRMTCRRSDRTTIVPTCLGLELGDRVTVNRRPHGGTLSGDDHIVQGYTERWGVDVDLTWEMVFQFSPAETQDYWIVGVSHLGTETRLAA